MAIFGAMSAGMAAAKDFALYLVLMAVYGVALTAVQTTITTSLQEHTESSLQGRVFGFMGAMYAVCYPAGMAIFGLMADWMPLQWSMAGAGVVLILLGGGIAAGKMGEEG